MSIEESIFDYVSGVPLGAEIGTRRPRGTDKPFIAWRRSGREEEEDLGGPAGVVTARFTFRIYANRIADLEPIAKRLRDRLRPLVGALDALTICSISCVDESDDDDPPVDGNQATAYVRELIFEVLYTEG